MVPTFRSSNINYNVFIPFSNYLKVVLSAQPVMQCNATQWTSGQLNNGNKCLYAGEKICNLSKQVLSLSAKCLKWEITFPLFVLFYYNHCFFSFLVHSNRKVLENKTEYFSTEQILIEHILHSCKVTFLRFLTCF